MNRTNIFGRIEECFNEGCSRQSSIFAGREGCCEGRERGGSGREGCCEGRERRGSERDGCCEGRERRGSEREGRCEERNRCCECDCCED